MDGRPILVCVAHSRQFSGEHGPLRAFDPSLINPLLLQVYREVTDRAHARCPPEGRRASRRRGNANDLSPEQLAEQKLSRSLVGCLSDSNGRYKVNGLIKKVLEHAQPLLGLKIFSDYHNHLDNHYRSRKPRPSSNCLLQARGCKAWKTAATIFKSRYHVS